MDRDVADSLNDLADPRVEHLGQVAPSMHLTTTECPKRSSSRLAACLAVSLQNEQLLRCQRRWAVSGCATCQNEMQIDTR